MRAGDYVRYFGRLASVQRVMFDEVEIKEFRKYGATKNVDRHKVEVIAPHTCEICRQRFDDADLSFREIRGYVRIICADCINDIEPEEDDCPACGGSGGGREHWKCDRCKGTGRRR